MHVVVDILLVAVFGVFTLKGYFKGFAKAVLSFGRFILSFAVAALFGSTFSDLIGGVSDASPVLNTAIAYVLLFVIAYVLMTVVILLVGKLVKLPVLKQADKLLGLVLGVLNGLIAVSLIATVTYAVLYATNNLGVYEDSTVFGFVYDLHFFKFLFDNVIS